MPDALLDTTVLYAAANRNAQRHERALSIVREADRGALPELRVPDPILVETMNGVTRDVGHDTAVDLLDRLTASVHFDLVREPMAIWAAGLDRFRTVERLSLADAILIASADHHDIEYVFSFDDDFDGLESVLRLDDAENPFAP